MEDLLERDIPWSAKATFFTGLKAKEAGWKQQATGAALGGIAGAGAGFLRYRADKSGTSVAERSARCNIITVSYGRPVRTSCCRRVNP